MKKIFLTLFILLGFPLITRAEWWNPKTWIKPEIKYIEVEKIVEKPIEIIKEVEVYKENLNESTEKEPFSNNKITELNQLITSLRKTNATLQNKIVDLEYQLSQAKTAVEKSNSTTPTTKIDNSEKINQINKKIAELDLVKWKYNNLKYPQDILEILNDTKTLDGKPMFPHQAFETTVKRGNANDTELRGETLPDRNKVWQIIEEQVVTMKVELASLGGSLD